jgi:peptide/nickel transport system permease protein
MSTAAPLRAQWSALRRDGIAHAALWLLALLVLAAIAAPLLSPQNPYDLAQLDILDARQPPGTAAGTGYRLWLGSDDQGRDMLSAILHGLRISLGVAAVATLLALGIGLVAGLASARAGGWIDLALMRLVDLQLSFPAILVALILLALTGPGLDRIVAAVVVVQWAYYARTVRAVARTELQREYVEAAVCAGVRPLRLLWRHLLPNVLPPLLVVATVQMAQTVALEATLSFLGLGLPVTEPSLGLLIANGYTHLLSGKYWISLFPGIALLALIVSINLVGDRLREQLDPRLRDGAAAR